MTKRHLSGLFLLLALALSAAMFQGPTKIAPTVAPAGDPFSIVDAAAKRLVDGSVAIFRLGGIVKILPLETHHPYSTARGRLAADMVGGEYTVSVRLPNGTEIALGSFTVLGPPSPSWPSLYVLASSDGFAGPHRIAEGTINADGTVSFPATLRDTNGLSNLNSSDSGLAVSSDRAWLFVGHNESNLVEAFARQPDGSLISTSTIPIQTAGSIIAHPTLPMIYVADLTRPTPSFIKALSYTPGGILAVSQTVATPDELRGIALTADGAFLITTHIGFFSTANRVEVYAVDAAGHVSATPVDTEFPLDAGRIADVVVDAATGGVYIKDLDRGIYGYHLDGSGALTPMNGGVPFPVSGNFLHDVKAANGRLVALSGFGSVFIDVFEIQPAGLALASTLAVHDGQQRLAVTADGTTVFASSRLFDGYVRSYAVSPTLAIAEVPGSPAVVPAAGLNLGRLIATK